MWAAFIKKQLTDSICRNTIHTRLTVVKLQMHRGFLNVLCNCLRIFHSGLFEINEQFVQTTYYIFNGKLEIIPTIHSISYALRHFGDRKQFNWMIFILSKKQAATKSGNYLNNWQYFNTKKYCR